VTDRRWRSPKATIPWAQMRAFEGELPDYVSAKKDGERQHARSERGKIGTLSRFF
jgi:hypothetical protein